MRSRYKKCVLGTWCRAVVDSFVYNSVDNMCKALSYKGVHGNPCLIVPKTHFIADDDVPKTHFTLFPLLW